MSADLFSVTGRRILVTGASSGLGAHFAQMLGARGARVALAARSVDKLQVLAQKIRDEGGAASAFFLDVDQVDSIAGCVREVESTFDGIDVLINNSGVTVTRRLEDISPQDFDQVMSTNPRGAFFTAQAVAAGMRQRQAELILPTIVNVASAAALKPLPLISAYGASKAALVHLTRTMAQEWGRYGININALCPGYIRTSLNEAHWDTDAGKRLIDRLPRQRVGDGSVLDGHVLLLCSSASRFMNGAVVTVDDGMTA